MRNEALNVGQVSQSGQESSRVAKQRRVRDFLDAKELDGILLKLQSNFAWYTDGARGHVNLASEESIAEILVTRTDEHLFVNSIEHQRLLTEEIEWRIPNVHIHSWWDVSQSKRFLKDSRLRRVETDAGVLRGEFARLRFSLLPDEVGRYKKLGSDVAGSLWETAQLVRAGMTEFDLAAELSLRMTRQGISPLTLLVAFDERTRAYRHPLPTKKVLKNIAIVSVCGRRSGLVVSASRMIACNTITADVRARQSAVSSIDAWLLQNTLPGVRIADLFDGLIRQYAKHGYPTEWHLHHQGGATGYTTRDFKASSSSEEVVLNNQAFAWNPTITGTKSEDTILVNKKGFEILTFDARWPAASHDVNGSSVKRPGILTLD